MYEMMLEWANKYMELVGGPVFAIFGAWLFGALAPLPRELRILTVAVIIGVGVWVVVQML